MLHPQLDFDRTYFRRTSGGRKLIGLEEGVREEEMGLAYYILNSTESLQKTVEREEVLKKEIEEDHKREDWEKEDQAPSGPDIASIKQRCQRSCDWLKKGDLKKTETEGLITASLPASKLSHLGERSVSRENARASGEAARGSGKESLQRSLIKFHLYFAQTKGNTIGWKMTFRKTKLIDNRPSWHPLRLCDKFGSQGDQIGTENLFQSSKQTRELVWFSSR